MRSLISSLVLLMAACEGPREEERSSTRADPLLSSTPWTTDPTDQFSAAFGTAVASAGDVNGDGYDDVIVGGILWDGQAGDEGKAWLYTGGPTGLSAAPVWSADPANEVSGRFGYGVAGVGDVNNDGFADVVVGAQNWPGSQGSASLYLGSATGLSTTAAWTAQPTGQGYAHFGSEVAGAGDVNGDGFSDVLISAPDWDGTAADEGRVYLYLGSATGLGASPAWTSSPTGQLRAHFGFSVDGAGDVNRDGYDDVVIGAPWWNGTVQEEGRAYLFLGQASGLATAPAWVVNPTAQRTANFGESVAGAGDVNGDGFDDVAVGADQWDGNVINEGRAYLYLGGPTGLAASAAWTADPTDQDAFFGRVASAGDVNGDGFGDLLVSASGWTSAFGREGRAYLYLGGPTGLSSVAAWLDDPSDTAFAGFGYAIAGAGDVNGDGLDDVIAGANGWGTTFAEEGRVWVYQGDGVLADAGLRDAGLVDAGPRDAGLPDAGPRDAGLPDAGPQDAGPQDAGPQDAGPPDAGLSDAGLPDAGRDAGMPDAGTVADAGVRDAGPQNDEPDAGAAEGKPPRGCGCGSGGGELFFLVALLLRRRASAL